MSDVCVCVSLHVYNFIYLYIYLGLDKCNEFRSDIYISLYGLALAYVK